MLSELAISYLAILEREDAVRDKATIQAAFVRAGIPAYDPVVDFQMQFGGYIQSFFRWGILHEFPVEDSYFAPNEIHVEQEDGQDRITCCNCHGSDHWSLDSAGTFYYSGVPYAASFAKEIERDALRWQLRERFGGYQRLAFSQPTAEVLNWLIPRIADGLVASASDEYEALYLHRNLFACVVDDVISAGVVGDCQTDVLIDGEYTTKWQRF